MTAAVVVAPFTEAEHALNRLSLNVRRAGPKDRLAALRAGTLALIPMIKDGYLTGAVVENEVFTIANDLDMGGDPGSAEELEIYTIARRALLAILDEESEPPPVSGPQDFGLPVDGMLDQAPAPIPPLTTVCPPAWRDIPLEPMRWLATNRIPAGDVTILSGDGGGGKTTVALQLAVAVERDLGDWLGAVCVGGPVIFFSGEEPEQEMRRRLARVARQRGLDPADIEGLHFHFADPDRCLLGMARPNGPIVATPLFDSLVTAVLDIRPALVVVDSIAAVFGGNQNDRTHARSFVGMFRKLARQADCAIMLLDHPSLSGITNGTGRGGSMDWQNATRARLHLETTADEDGGTGRVLEVKKTNYGPSGEKVRLQWEEGCFVLEAVASSPQLAKGYAAADQAYLDCLDATTAQGRHVCHAKGRGYAPKAFAEMPQANGMTWKAFQAAQERLFAAGIIENIPYGPPSKGTKQIARKVPS